MCYNSLQNYFNFANACKDWEDKLKRYIQHVRLRKRRKFCLENFQQNIETLDKDQSSNIRENFVIIYNDEKVNIKHEVVELDNK